ncbi:MAG: FAD-dependent oxidoreductase [Erythrobacter sp.]
MGQARTALVIGGGVIGVTSAYMLSRDGWKVRLIEREGGLAKGASLGNGRQLSYSHTNALANPGLLPQIPGLLLGCNEAFRLSLRPDLRFADWSLRMLANATGSAYRRNTLETLALAVRSQRAMETLLDRHPFEFDRRKAGKLVLLRTEKEIRSARASVELKTATGLRQELLDANEACEIEPALAQSSDPATAAIYSPDDETGDCAAFTQGLFDVAATEYGLELLANTTVSQLERKNGRTNVAVANGEVLEADLVVVANGDAAADLLAHLGHRVPIEPMKGYSFTAPIGNSPPQVSITDSKRRIVFTNIGNRMLVAGIAEMGRLDGAIDQERLASMQDSARESLPEAALYSESDHGWVGFRPMTPNSQPITRMLEPGLAINSGHGMLGWTLAMGSAERLSELVADA